MILIDKLSNLQQIKDEYKHLSRLNTPKAN